MSFTLWFLLIIGLQLVLIAIIARLYLKLRNTGLMLYKTNDDIRLLKEEVVIQSANVTQQHQATRWLERDLAVDRPLPPMRGWAASPDFLLALTGFVAEHRPRVIVECGSGVSTLVLARTCQRVGQGHVYSLDHSPDFAARTAATLRDWGLADFATVIPAPLSDRMIGGGRYSWYGFESLPVTAIDVLVVDGPPERVGKLARYPAGPVLLPMLAEDGVCFVDDADRPDETEMVRLWQAEFPGLTATNLYCEKGGVLLRRTGSTGGTGSTDRTG